MPTLKETNVMTKPQLLEELVRLRTVINDIQTDRSREYLEYERLKTDHVKLQQHDSVHREAIRIIGKLHK